jgi:hypothetical protein
MAPAGHPVAGAGTPLAPRPGRPGSMAPPEGGASVCPLARCAMIHPMVEYGGGINQGPAGQVAGSGGGAPQFGGSTDLFSSVGNVVNDGVNWVSSLPPETLLIGIVVFFLGLIILKRAF